MRNEDEKYKLKYFFIAIYAHVTVERLSNMTVEKKNEKVLDTPSKKAKGNDKRKDTTI